VADGIAREGPRRDRREVNPLVGYHSQCQGVVADKGDIADRTEEKRQADQRERRLRSARGYGCEVEAGKEFSEQGRDGRNDAQDERRSSPPHERGAEFIRLCRSGLGREAEGRRCAVNLSGCRGSKGVGRHGSNLASVLESE
jgi:hypothetical protein